MTDDELEELGFVAIRRMPDGTINGVQLMLFTAALTVGIDPIGYKTRYCYESPIDAIGDLMNWDGTGDPIGPWIKQKPEDRLNPRLLTDEGVTENG